MPQGPLANVTPPTHTQTHFNHTHTPILLRGRCEATLYSPVLRAAPLRWVTGQRAVTTPPHPPPRDTSGRFRR